jgi:hypothetical protein
MVLPLTLFAALGCGDATGPTGVTGTYVLQAVDGATVPAVYSVHFESDVFEGEPVDVVLAWQVVAGSLRLSGDSTFTANHFFRQIVKFLTVDTGEEVFTALYPEQPREIESGTFSVAGTVIQIMYANRTLNGSVSGDVLTLTEGIRGGGVWAYER